MIVKFRILKELLQHICYILDREQKKRSIKIFVHMLIASLLETLSVSLIVPFLTVLTQSETMRENKYIVIFMNIFGVKGTEVLIAIIGVCFIGIYLIKNSYLLYVTYLQISYRAGLQKELAAKMLFSYISRPYTFFLDINTGDLMRGINSDTAGVYKTVDLLFHIIAEVITVICLGIYLSFSLPELAFGTVVVVAIIVLLMIFGFKNKMQKAGIKLRKATGRTNQSILQTIGGIKEIFVLQKKEFFYKKYEMEAEELKKAIITSNFIPAFPSKIVEVLFVTFFIFFVVFVMRVNGDISTIIPQLGAYAFASLKILPAISSISGNFTHIISLRPALNGAYENFKEANEYEQERQIYRKCISSRSVPEDSMLVIQNIRWIYPGGTDYVLDDVQISISLGESIALIGESGAGKTTLADIILGLLQPKEGSVRFRGKDIFANAEWWSRTVGYVAQTVYLFDDTIRANIALGVRAEDIDEQKIWDVLEQSQLKKFVETLPRGLDTLVGERGIKFSGGQRQRIAIARALYNDPEILVLDEATSALDMDTESAVMEAIENLRGKKTLIIIAHRLSTIKNCDKIYVIEKKKAVLKRHDEVFETNN